MTEEAFDWIDRRRAISPKLYQLLSELNRSPAAVRAYRVALTYIQHWLRDSGRALDAAALGAYFASHKWAASTQNRKQTAIERHYRRSRQQGGSDLDSTRHLKRPKIPPPHLRGLSRDDLKCIFAVIRGQDTMLKSYSAKKNPLSHTRSRKTLIYAVQT